MIATCACVCMISTSAYWPNIVLNIWCKAKIWTLSFSIMSVTSLASNLK